MPRLQSELTCEMASVRRSRGLTQKDLARQCGVSRQTVVEIENGNYNPSTIVSLRLATALETSVEELFKLPGEVRK